ncbi:hypothetical protein [Frankia sp. CiP3]|uniref:hypothetical protein n=1 Tax=Frankia sp. CiP3 TaxID=2880971 RepID=UPI001EF6E86A|nr:hypothetical protein [Frankia sp. CiP3]
MQLGAPWIPAADIGEFIGDLLGIRPVPVYHSPTTATWAVDLGRNHRARLVAAYSEWGTRRANAFDLIEKALNLLRLAFLTLQDLEAGDTAFDAALDDGFRASLDTDSPDDLAVRVNGWLDVAVSGANGDDVRAVELLGRMIDFCRGRLDLLSQLHWHLAAWPYDSENPEVRDGREVRCQIQARIEQHLRIRGADRRPPTSAPPSVVDWSGAQE